MCSFVVMPFSFTMHHENRSKLIGKDLIQMHTFNDCLLFHVVDMLQFIQLFTNGWVFL